MLELFEVCKGQGLALTWRHSELRDGDVCNTSNLAIDATLNKLGPLLVQEGQFHLHILMLLLDGVIWSLDQLLQQVLVLLVDAMHHIFIHEVAIQVLSFFVVLFFALYALLVNYFEPVKRTDWSFLQVATRLLLGAWL